MFNVHGLNTTEGTCGTQDWKELTMEFDSGNEARVLVHCLFGGCGGATGNAYYDDVFLTEISNGNSDSTAVDGVVKYFVASGDAAARTALANNLSTRNDALSKKLAASLGVAPVEFKAIIRKYPPNPAVIEHGLAIYSRTCIACHGPDGKGVSGAFPPLDGSSWAVGDPSIPARIVLAGLQGPIEVSGQKFANVMPSAHRS